MRIHTRMYVYVANVPVCLFKADTHAQYGPNTQQPEPPPTPTSSSGRVNIKIQYPQNLAIIADRQRQP